MGEGRVAVPVVSSKRYRASQVSVYSMTLMVPEVRTRQFFRIGGQFICIKCTSLSHTGKLHYLLPVPVVLSGNNPDDSASADRKELWIHMTREWTKASIRVCSCAKKSKPWELISSSSGTPPRKIRVETTGGGYENPRHTSCAPRGASETPR